MSVSQLSSARSAVPRLGNGEETMLMKTLWGLLIVSNLIWFVTFRIIDKDRWQEVNQREQVEQQRDVCQGQVGKLTDTMSKLCACGK
jgi:hypothetical protein